MKGNKIQRQSSKGVSILAFFLGVLFGIILLLGAIAGGVYYVLNADVDSVLGWFGVDNSADENGDNKYINTNADKDGVASVLELITRITEMAGNYQNLTIGQIDALLPATHGLVDQIIEAVSDYVTVDYGELSAVKFSEFQAYFTELVYDIQPAKIVENTSGVEMNNLIRLLLYGVEADCVTVDGEIYPLYLDTATQTYIYAVGEDWYVAEETDDGFLTTGVQYQSYNKENTEPTGNYYTVGGQRVSIDPLTIRSFIETDGLGALGKVTVAELVGEWIDDENEELANKLLGDILLKDLINGDVDIKDKLNSLTIGDIIYIDQSDRLMSKLADCKISEVGSVIRTIELPEVIDIPATAIMAYIGYGVTKVDTEAGTAEFNGETVYITTETIDGTLYITGVYGDSEYTEESRIAGTKVNEVSGCMDGLMKDLTVGELIGVDDSSSTILRAIKNSTIESLSEDINNLTVNSLYAESIYVDPAMKQVVVADPVQGQVAFSPEYLYYELADGEYVLVGGTGKVLSYRSNLYTFGEVKGFWQLLIMELADDGSKSEKAYSLNSVADMANNLSNNLIVSSLDDLYRAGVITFEEGTENPLGKVIPQSISEKYGNRTLGSLTISETVAFVAEFLTL